MDGLSRLRRQDNSLSWPPRGGGFLLLIASPERHRAIREALGRPREHPFRISRHGSRIIFYQD